MINSEVKGNISLKPIEEFFIRDIAARSVAKVGREFSDYLRNRRFNQLFDDQTGKTRESIGLHRRKGKTPAYIVRAGIGIPGSLNYLKGLYRGHAVSRSGKVFSFARQRNLIDDGWKMWGGKQKAVAVGEEMLQRAVNEAEKKLEG
ncbi:MAG: hypothetical protein FWB82_04205 [Treponema sp.]|nr:hypothetical protein [Treponema sp.]